MPVPDRQALTAARLRLEAWFRSRGWEPLAFQSECWEAYLGGKSGLLEVPTGSGKTYAAFGGPLIELLAQPTAGEVCVLYITPLRAVAHDIARALSAPLEELAPSMRVAVRTGDTPSAEKQRQRKDLPEVLVTTPESLALLLTHEDFARSAASLRAVILDEWHEMVGSKRGALLELSLARLRRLAPQLRTWALSATVGNPEDAMACALGVHGEGVRPGEDLERPVEITTLLPEQTDAFPWAGHLGLAMLPAVRELLADRRPTLLFTNTRNQAESWFRALTGAEPGRAAEIGLHHGSLAHQERERVEGGLKDGTLRVGVATSSLDLGVDFSPIERVVQVGSPKGIARLLQRAGRSAHRPGATCHLVFVPTNALELLEITAARRALRKGKIEPKEPLRHPFDVLAQHLVSRALGGGFEPAALHDEVRSAYSFRALSREDFEWTLDLVHRGGTCLKAYPEYRKLVEREGRLHVAEAKIARLHRMNLGTIPSDVSVGVQLAGRASLGSVEERFLARLKPGDIFWFAGRCLELVSLEEDRARVRVARTEGNAVTPQWMGGRMPLSSCLADETREVLGELSVGREVEGDEIAACAPILDAQRELSALPGRDELLLETTKTAIEDHLFLYPFEGRLVHEGLVVLLAHRLTQRAATSFTLSVNDYGFHLATRPGYPFEDLLEPGLFTEEGLTQDIEEAIALGQMARRRFREVAEVAGLVTANQPGRSRPLRQLQASATLLYEVFARYDPQNLLLAQARREVFELNFEERRLRRALRRLESAPWKTRRTRRVSPLAFPLLVEQIRARVSAESLEETVRRLKETCSREAASSASEGSG